MGSATISFKEMKLKDYDRTVQILGDCFGEKIEIELSVLQIAKVFGTDRKIANETEEGFGSEKLEDQCDETRELIKKFPDIDVWSKEVKFPYVSVTNRSVNRDSKDMSKGLIEIYAEDIVGWGNEGLKIWFPKNLYEKLLNEKGFSFAEGEFKPKDNFLVKMNPFCVQMKTKKDS